MKYPLRLFNSMGREIQEFVPMVPGNVGLYSCGPTVYSFAHIGNMRTYIFVDILRRTLEYAGYDVNHVMNITDVGHLTGDTDEGEDRMEVGAKREGLNAWQIAQKYTDAFFSQSAKLNIQRPKIVCKATEHIKEQIELVQALEKNGFTYKTSDGIYFDTAKFPDYGKLAGMNLEGLEAGIRVEMGEKRNKTDFALWKFSKPEDRRAMEWPSPWGTGFPGWHIECSAMSMKYLGKQFDMHTGGVDHITIHHPNEIAQSECATSVKPFVKYWLHGEFLLTGGKDEKMSKSLGHILTVDALEQSGFPPMAYRYLCLSSHYRKQLKFSEEVLGGAATAINRLHGLVSELKRQASLANDDLGQCKYVDQFEKAISNDLNMPQVLANTWTMLEDSSLSPASKLQRLAQFDRVLGLRMLEDRKEVSIDVPEDVMKLVRERDECRKTKRWADSDRLRAEIIAKGYDVLDTPQGAKVKKK